MKKIYAHKLFLTLSLLVLIYSQAANAQIWSVGNPVNMNLSMLSRTVGGCYPSADLTFGMYGSQVTGVPFYAIITAVPANSVYMDPGMDTLAVGDSIALAYGFHTYSIFCFGAGGNLTIDFRAVGVPVTAGQQYPCQASNNWISNLMFCPDGLQSTLGTGCLVEPGNGTGIANISNQGFTILFPESKNDYLLSVNSNQIIRQVSVINILGKEVVHADCRDRAAKLDCSSVSDGIYFVRIITEDGKAQTRKFVFKH